MCAGGLSGAGRVSSARALFCWQEQGQQGQQEQGQQEQEQPEQAQEEGQQRQGQEPEASQAGGTGRTDSSTGVGLYRSGACVLALHGGVVIDLMVAQVQRVVAVWCGGAGVRV